MTSTERGKLNRFTTAFSSLAASPLRATFFRSIDARYASTPLSAIGSIMSGGRYNHIHDFEAFYVADNLSTALFEVQALSHAEDGTIQSSKMPPRIDLSIDVVLQRSIDLRTDDVLAALHVTKDDLLLPWRLAQDRGEYPVTQLLGAAARTAEIEGLLVPSAKVATGTNPVVVVDRLVPASSYTLYLGDSKALPVSAVKGTYNANRRSTDGP